MYRLFLFGGVIIHSLTKTRTTPFPPRKNAAGRTAAGRVGALFLTALLFFFFFLLLRRSEPLAEAAYEALVFSGKKLLPALFPFAILSRFLLHSGLLSGGEKGLAARLTRPFGLPGDALPALVAGLFCGFPLGALTASSLLEEGKLDEKSAWRLAAFCNNAGAGFLLGSASSLFRSAGENPYQRGPLQAGLLLLLAQTAASLTVGLVLGRRAKKEKTAAGHTAAPALATVPANPPPLLPLLSDCIVKGGTAMLSVTSFVVFFAVLLEALSLFPLLTPVLPYLAVFLEVSAGLRMAAGSLPLTPALLLSAFGVGWSGLSVFLQAEALFKGKLPLLYLAAVRLAIALLSVLFALLLLPLFIG